MTKPLIEKELEKLESDMLRGIESSLVGKIMERVECTIKKAMFLISIRKYLNPKDSEWVVKLSDIEQILGKEGE